jgi:hypothetical protein
VRLRDVALCAGACVALAGCEQLGNPPQYATPPTPWRDANGHLVTSTRSFRNANTIRRLVADGMDDVDYSDPSIGPSQTLTVVVVVPRSFRASRRGEVPLVTRFELPNGRSLERRWKVVPENRKWSAAFALPAPPDEAVTAVAP